MTPIDWGVIIGKAPDMGLLVIFAIVVLELQKRWAAAQDKRDELYEKRNTALVDAITKMGMVISALNDNSLKHNTEMHDAVEEMRTTSNNLVQAVRGAIRQPKKATGEK